MQHRKRNQLNRPPSAVLVPLSGCHGDTRKLVPGDERQVEPIELLREALQTFGNRISLACSFSLEDVTLVHMLMQLDAGARVFAIDTGRLPEETHACAEALRVCYGTRIEWHFPDAKGIAELIHQKGPYSFRESLEDRKECCFIRKVLPLQQALDPLDAWITGQRREQNETRTQLSQVEIDYAHGSKLKLNPLVHWTLDDVRQYVAEHRVPYNRLYDLGYSSIGCSPCTRAVSPGEDQRAGRWWWEEAQHKECGLHLYAENRKETTDSK